MLPLPASTLNNFIITRKHQHSFAWTESEAIRHGRPQLRPSSCPRLGPTMLCIFEDLEEGHTHIHIGGDSMELLLPAGFYFGFLACCAILGFWACCAILGFWACCAILGFLACCTILGFLACLLFWASWHLVLFWAFGHVVQQCLYPLIALGCCAPTRVCCVVCCAVCCVVCLLCSFARKRDHAPRAQDDHTLVLEKPQM